MAYSLAALNYLIRSEVNLVVKTPELDYFNVSPAEVAWGLPGAIALACYIVQRVKFWYIDEGDLVFNFSAWAKQANERMDWIETDGVREEDNFQFLIEGDEIVREADGKPKKRQPRQKPVDYSDFNEVAKQIQNRETYNTQASLRNKRLTNMFKRKEYGLDDPQTSARK